MNTKDIMLQIEAYASSGFWIVAENWKTILYAVSVIFRLFASGYAFHRILTADIMWVAEHPWMHTATSMVAALVGISAIIEIILMCKYRRNK